MDNILQLEGITKNFNGFRVIDNLDLKVTCGTISAIIGPNGAGKTTLFNLICGYLSIDKGIITYREKNVTNLLPWVRSGLGIGRLFQDIRVFKKLTVLENLLVTFNDASENPFKAVFFSQRDGKERVKIALEWLDFVGLAGMRDRFAESLSWGQQKLLSLARLLCGKFDLLLIDEPVSGVNPEMIDVILSKIRELKGLGKTIIVVEHNMEAVEAISDYIYFMDSGKITASGPPEQVLKNQKVMEGYIGI